MDGIANDKDVENTTERTIEGKHGALKKRLRKSLKKKKK